jgi:hypothetical protein
MTSASAPLPGPRRCLGLPTPDRDGKRRSRTMATTPGSPVTGPAPAATRWGATTTAPHSRTTRATVVSAQRRRTGSATPASAAMSTTTVLTADVNLIASGGVTVAKCSCGRR